ALPISAAQPCGFGIGLPVLTEIRSFVPSAATRMRTRVGSPVVGSISITFDAEIGASNVMIPPSGFCGEGRRCRLRRFTPLTTTRFSFGSTRRTVPSVPAKFPRITLTRSPRRTCTFGRFFCSCFPVLRRLPPIIRCAMSDHLRRQRNDLHEPLLTQLAPDRTEYARPPRLARVVDDHRGVVVATDVRPVLAPHLLRRADHDRLRHIPLLQRPIRERVLYRHDDDVAHPSVATPRTAQHPDAERLLRPRVVGDPHDRFLLNHCRLTSLARSLRARATAWSWTVAVSP